MKFNQKTVCIIIIAVILFGVQIFLTGYRFYNSEKTDMEEANLVKGIVVFQTEPESVQNIKLINKNGTFEYSRDNGNWIILTPENLVSTHAIINLNLKGFFEVIAEDEIEKDCKDLTKYGLSEPQAEAIILYGDNKKIKFYLGDNTPGEQGNYFKTDFDDTIYKLANSETIADMSISSYALKSKALFPSDWEEYKSISLFRKDEPIFTLEKTQTDIQITYPVKKTADEKFVKFIKNALTTVQIVEFVENGTISDDEFGLIKPNYLIEVQTNLGNYKLTIGNDKTIGWQKYAAINNQPDIFTVNPQEIYFLDIRKDRFNDDSYAQ